MFIVYLSYIYPIFILYLLYVVVRVIVGFFVVLVENGMLKGLFFVRIFWKYLIFRIFGGHGFFRRSRRGMCFFADITEMGK